MTVINSSKNNILISSDIVYEGSEIIKPRGSWCDGGMNLYILNIHSELGSCEIKTKYGKTFIRNFGKLYAKVSNEKDQKGMKMIIVTSVE